MDLSQAPFHSVFKFIQYTGSSIFRTKIIAYLEDGHFYHILYGNKDRERFLSNLSGCSVQQVAKQFYHNKRGDSRSVWWIRAENHAVSEYILSELSHGIMPTGGMVDKIKLQEALK